MGKLRAILAALVLAAGPMGTAAAATDAPAAPAASAAEASVEPTGNAQDSQPAQEAATPEASTANNAETESDSFAPGNDGAPADSAQPTQVDEPEAPEAPEDPSSEASEPSELPEAPSPEPSEPMDASAGTARTVKNTPVFRVYNPFNGEHLLTAIQYEAAVLEADGWYDEGTSFESDTGGDLSVHRLYNRVSQEHHYTADPREIEVLSAGDWNDEGESFRAYAPGSEAAAASAPVAVYRLYNGQSGIGSHHYTTSKSEHDTLVSKGWRSEGIAFCAVKEGTPKQWPDWASGKIQTVNVHRVYNAVSGEHLYTTNGNELADLVLRGWHDEGVGWRSPSWSVLPVIRLHNPVLGDHHYTTDFHEVETLVERYGWTDEGIAFFSSEQKEVAVYRQFHPAATIGAHNFTTSKDEYEANNASAGWRGEGVAWYAKAAGTPKTAPGPKVDCTKDKCVAFTFDDGPTRIHTPMLLDVLRNHNVHGTFFAIGQNVERFPELVAREVAEGHAVGSHTWSHPYLTRISAEDIRSELDRTDAAISKAIGYGTRTTKVPFGMTVSGGQLHTQYMRPPYGDVDDAVHAVLEDKSKTSIKWSVDSLDWKYRDVDTSIERVREGVRPGSIVLWHDLHPVAVKALDTLIDELQEQGYHFVTIPELLDGQSVYGRSITSWP